MKAQQKKAINVNSLANFEFWLGMFKPRTAAWQRKKLKELKGTKQNQFTNLVDRDDKIKALEFLLN